MFKVDIHVRNGTPDVSKPISHDKLLHYRFLIGITVNNYNLPRSLKGDVPVLVIRPKRSSGRFIL